MDETIRAALELLDPSDDAHWTTSGMPKVDIVAELAECKVTRKDIERVAPGMVREPGALDESDESGDDSDDASESADAATQSNAPAPLPGLPPEIQQRAEDHAKAKARKAELSAALVEVDREIAELNAKREAILAETRKASAQAEATRDTFAISSARAKATAMADAKRRADRMAAYEAATKGVAGRRINPIDEHFKRRGRRAGPTPGLPRSR